MPRADKVQAVAAIKDRIEGANAVFLAEYSGLSVKDQQTLRRSLRSGGAEFKVVKMTLARLAAEELEIDTLNDLLLGPTGLAFADDDAVVAAKALRDFAKEHDVFRIKGGLLGRDFLTPERVGELAEIEPRPVLLGRVAGAARAPMAKMANLLAALPRGLATAMQQLFERMEQDEPAAGEHSGPEELSDEQSVDEAPANEAPSADKTLETEGSGSNGDPSDDASDEGASDEDAVTDAGDDDEMTESEDEPADQAEEE